MVDFPALFEDRIEWHQTSDVANRVAIPVDHMISQWGFII